MELPRAADILKPSPKIRDATVSVISQLQGSLLSTAVTVLEDSLLRAPDKAPLRSMAADASAAVALRLDDAARRSWLEFLALLLASPQAARRLLGLLALEPLVAAILDASVLDWEQGVCARPLPELL